MKVRKTNETIMGQTNNISDLSRAIDDIHFALKDLLLKKHQDYGPLNIAQAPGGALNGLRVRIYDKLARINNLVELNNDTPNYESLEDSFIDLANYAIIGLLVQKGQWEGLPSGTNQTKDYRIKRSSSTVPRPCCGEGGDEFYPPRKT